MLQDLQSAFRQMRRQPAFTAAVVVTLGLGVGATAAVFTLADPMLFRPLPYTDAHRIVTARVTGRGTFGFLQIADFLPTAERHSRFEAVASFDPAVVIRVPGLDDTAFSYAVTTGFFKVLGVKPLLGRLVLSEEHRVRHSEAEVAVITYGLWRDAFGARVDAMTALRAE